MLIFFLLVLADPFDHCRKFNIPINDCVDSIYKPNKQYDNYVNSFNLPIIREKECENGVCCLLIDKGNVHIRRGNQNTNKTCFGENCRLECKNISKGETTQNDGIKPETGVSFQIQSMNTQTQNIPPISIQPIINVPPIQVISCSQSGNEISQSASSSQLSQEPTVTVTRILTETTTVEKPMTLYREVTTTNTVEIPIINYKVTTVTENLVSTKTHEITETSLITTKLTVTETTATTLTDVSTETSISTAFETNTSTVTSVVPSVSISTVTFTESKIISLPQNTSTHSEPENSSIESKISLSSVSSEPEKIITNLPEKIITNIPEKISSTIPDKISSSACEKITTTIPEKITTTITTTISEKISLSAPEEIKSSAPEKMTTTQISLSENITTLTEISTTTSTIMSVSTSNKVKKYTLTETVNSTVTETKTSSCLLKSSPPKKETPERETLFSKEFLPILDKLLNIRNQREATKEISTQTVTLTKKPRRKHKKTITVTETESVKDEKKTVMNTIYKYQNEGLKTCCIESKDEAPC